MNEKSNTSVDAEDLLSAAAKDPDATERLSKAQDIETFIKELVQFAEKQGSSITEEQARGAVLEAFTQASRQVLASGAGSEAALSLALRAGAISPTPSADQLRDQEIELVLRVSPLQMVNWFIFGDLTSWCATGKKKVTKYCA